MSRGQARALVQRLVALPREAGTPGAAEARRLVAGHLAALGYGVNEEPFRFPPAALDAFRLFGAGLLTLALLAMPFLSQPGLPAWGALLVLGGGLPLVGAIALGVGAGWVELGAGTREDANLVARRGGEPVRTWLVAHLDTKAQGQSTAGRLVAIWVLAAAGVALLAAAAWRLEGPVPLPAVAGAELLAVAGTGLAARSRLRGTSPGARDNASGLLAVLLAAERAGPGVGVLVTGAEEFGLVGARIFAREHAAELRGADVLNVDTLDDAGRLVVVAHDPAGLALAADVARRIGEAGPARVRRLPAGILVDSLALARAGARAVTVARVGWGTLRRIHTPGDGPDGFAFATAERVGGLLPAD